MGGSGLGKPSEVCLAHLVSARTASEAFDVHAETLRRLYREGAIPGYRIGRYLRFDVDELREAFRAGRSAAPSGRVEPDFGALDVPAA